MEHVVVTVSCVIITHYIIMSLVLKDISKIWGRLFDHRNFLVGEITYVQSEFEQKRNDQEVDALFRAIENLVEIKDTELTRFEPVGTHILLKTNEDLTEALDLCSKFAGLEEKYSQDTTVEDLKSERKIDWDNFMQGITTRYTEINNSFEIKEEELKKSFEDIEKKLLV